MLNSVERAEAEGLLRVRLRTARLFAVELRLWAHQSQSAEQDAYDETATRTIKSMAGIDDGRPVHLGTLTKNTPKPKASERRTSIKRRAYHAFQHNC